MLADHTPHTVIATTDLARAQEFYEGVLGFSHRAPAPGGFYYEVGSGTVLLYQTVHAGTNKATLFGFELGSADFDLEIDRLRSSGVEFETFEMAGVTWDGGVARMGAAKAAWFTDPDGNAISVTSGIRDAV